VVAVVVLVLVGAIPVITQTARVLLQAQVVVAVAEIRAITVLKVVLE
jgi:hypothetical protein